MGEKVRTTTKKLPSSGILRVIEKEKGDRYKSQ